VTCVVRNDRRHALLKRAMLCPRSQMKTPSAMPALPPISAQHTVSELAAASAFGVGEVSIVGTAVYVVVVPVVPLGMYKGARQCHAEVAAHA